MHTYYADGRESKMGNQVHRRECPFLPDMHDLINLGKHGSIDEAMAYGATFFSGLRGCPACCSDNQSYAIRRLLADSDKAQHMPMR